MNKNDIEYIFKLIDEENYISLDRIAEELSFEPDRIEDKFQFLILTNGIKNHLYNRSKIIKGNEEIIFSSDEDVILDSPNFIPKEMIELQERGWKRINRKRHRYPAFTSEELKNHGNEIFKYSESNGTVIIVNENGDERMTLSIFGDNDDA